MGNDRPSQAIVVSHVVRIPVDNLEPGPNARGQLGDLTELAESLRTVGQQEPLLVYDLGHGRYRILDGHRRRAAAKLAKLPTLDAVVKAARDDKTRLVQQLALHVQRASFDPIAEAKAIHDLLFNQGVSHEGIARALGKSPKWVSGRLALLNLSEGDQALVAAGRMTLVQAAATVAERRAQRDGRPANAPRLEPRACPTCGRRIRTANA